MFRWMSGATREGRMRYDEYVRGNIGVTWIVEKKMRENRLRLFGHVMRRG